MKKILLILAATATTLAASSQTKELDNLAKRLQKSDEAIADPKKSASANTWLDHTSALIAASKVLTLSRMPVILCCKAGKTWADVLL